MATTPTPSIITSLTAQGVDPFHQPVKVANAFARPSLPAPDRSSPAADVLDFIAFDLGPERFPDNRSFLREDLRGICPEFGYDWAAVAKEVRRRMIRQYPLGADLADDDVEIRPSGVIVNHGAIRAITHDLMPFCPFKRRFVTTDTFSLTCFDKPCGG